MSIEILFPSLVRSDARLSGWRTKPPRELGMWTSELLNDLVNRFVPRTEEERHLYTAALGGEASAEFELGSRVIGRNDPNDVGMSWIALAALKGHIPATLAIAQELQIRVENLRHRAVVLENSDAPEQGTNDRRYARRLRREARRVAKLAKDWNERALDARVLVKRERLSFELNRGVELANADSEREPEPKSDVAVDGPSRVVVREIAQTGRDAKDIVQTYKRLMQPLSLTGGNIDPDVFRRVMMLKFPNFAPAIERIVDDLRLGIAVGQGWVRFRPLLLLGAPGIGKTTFAQEVARVLGTGYGEIGAGGLADNRMMAGTARGWASATPGFPLLTIWQTKCANPVILVDEIDKAGGSDSNGRVHHTLLSLLEPQTAKTWHDQCLIAPADLSGINWILTANALEPLRGPLLSRVAVVEVAAPAPTTFDGLLSSVLAGIARELDVDVRLLPELDEVVVDELRSHFMRGLTPRQLKHVVRRLLSASAGAPRTLN